MKKNILLYASAGVLMLSQNALSAQGGFQKVMCTDSAMCSNSKLNTHGGITEHITGTLKSNIYGGSTNDETVALAKLKNSKQGSAIYGGSVQDPSGEAKSELINRLEDKKPEKSIPIEIYDYISNKGTKAWASIVNILSRMVSSGKLTKNEANAQVAKIHKLPGKNVVTLNNTTASSEAIKSEACIFLGQLLTKQLSNDAQLSKKALQQALSIHDLSNVFILTASASEQVAQHFLYSSVDKKFYSIERKSNIIEIAVPSQSGEKDNYVFRDEDDNSRLINAEGLSQLMKNLEANLIAGKDVSNKDLGCNIESGNWSIVRAINRL